MAPARLIQAHQVDWGETDAAGIVFYPNYYRWFDRTAHELFRSVGFPVRQMLESGHAIPIIESGARFLAPLFYGDEISIGATVAEVRTRALRIEYRIESGGTLACEGHEVRAWVRLPESPGARLIAESLPPELRALLE